MNIEYTTNPKPVACPKCRKFDMVIPIVYGFPSPQLFEKVEKGLVKLGGCFIAPDNPEWYCKREGVNF